jgi:hypothetical protein
MNAQPTITALSIGRRGISRRTKPTRNFMTDSIWRCWTSDHWYALAVPRFIAIRSLWLPKYNNRREPIAAV